MTGLEMEWMAGPARTSPPASPVQSGLVNSKTFFNCPALVESVLVACSHSLDSILWTILAADWRCVAHVGIQT